MQQDTLGKGIISKVKSFGQKNTLDLPINDS